MAIRRSQSARNTACRSPQVPARFDPQHRPRLGLFGIQPKGRFAGGVTARLDRIADLLREAGPDVVVLNEVDFGSTWTHSVDQARHVAERAGFGYFAEQRNIDYRVLTWTWRFGNAVLSKYPIEAASALDLPGDPTWEKWAVGSTKALACDIRVGNQHIRVIGVHLSSFGEEVRVRSAHDLVAASAASPWPVIIAGDFNATAPGMPEAATDEAGANALAVFDASGRFRRSPQGANATESDFTFRANLPQTVLDWVLIPQRWRFVRYAVAPSLLSDHRPVIAEVSWD